MANEVLRLGTNQTLTAVVDRAKRSVPDLATALREHADVFQLVPGR